MKILTTTKQTAYLLGIHPLTLEGWMRRGLIPKPRKFGHTNRYNLVACLRSAHKHRLNFDTDALFILEHLK
jgi:DNA-binding transcriptional MerR regulator